MSDEPLKNAKDTAEALGLHPCQITRLTKSGIITPEIHEGRLVRFNVAKVRAVLAKRAKSASRQIKAPKENMIPTY